MGQKRLKMQKKNSGLSDEVVELLEERRKIKLSDRKWSRPPTKKGFIQTNRKPPGRGRRHRLRPKHVALNWSGVVERRRQAKHQGATK